MANAGCINAYDCNGCLIQTLQNLDSACIGVGVQYTAPNPLDDKRLDYIKYTDKCGCVQCLSGENEILIYATDGVIKDLTLTNDDVNEAIKIQWNDIFGSNRAKTIVRYKTGSYPVSITDGTLAVEETTKNQYSSTPFSLSGVLDETTYYITAFAVDSNNAVIGTQQTTITTDFGWHPSANTLCYYKFNGNYADDLGNYGNATGTSTFETLSSGIKVLKTNGSNVVILPSGITNNAKTTYTIAFRMKVITTDPGYGYYAGYGISGAGHFSFYESTAGRNYIEYGTTSSMNSIECTPSGIGSGRRLVVMRSNGTGRSNVSMLINGQYSETSRGTGGSDSSQIFGQNTQFAIGGRIESSSGSGQLTSVLISKFVISDDYRDNAFCLDMFNRTKSDYGL